MTQLSFDAWLEAVREECAKRKCTPQESKLMLWASEYYYAKRHTKKEIQPHNAALQFIHSIGAHAERYHGRRAGTIKPDTDAGAYAV